jgi:hypothetical protein
MLRSPRLPRLPLVVFGGLAAAVAAIAPLACGTDAVGVEACRQVEEARCSKAAACGISLELPPHHDTPASDVDACVRFYRDACLHGLESGKDPGAVELKACVDRIRTTEDCALVKAPQNAAECAWLVPPAAAPTPDAAPDAASTADAADANSADGSDQ